MKGTVCVMFVLVIIVLSLERVIYEKAYYKAGKNSEMTRRERI